MSNQTSVSGRWKITGEAAKFLIDKQAEFKYQHPCYRGKFSKQKTIELLLCELYEIKQKEKISNQIAQAGNA